MWEVVGRDRGSSWLEMVGNGGNNKEGKDKGKMDAPDVCRTA